jgi:DNA-binding PadR family transcriptional regulator
MSDEKEVRSKDPRLGPGSLWVSMPIPAIKCLTFAGKKQAQRVLFALVLHNDGTPRYVFPSRQTIEKYSGVGSNALTQAFRDLEEFGFIQIHKKTHGKVQRNEYEILRACWHWDEFNDIASRYKFAKGLCRSCRTHVYGNEWHKEERYRNAAITKVRIHNDCGGEIKELTREQLRKANEWQDEEIIRARMSSNLLGSELIY